MPTVFPALTLVLVSAAASLSCSTVCNRPLSPQASVSQLEPGQYELTMRATRGTEAGSIAFGSLTLVSTQAEHWGQSTLVGSADIDLDGVGAPVLEGEGPSPSSLDPDAPGVLVQRVDWDARYPEGTPVLLFGTVANQNPVMGTDEQGNEIVRIPFDGAGIGLWVHRASSGGFTGEWQPWGILHDGSGYFCARRIVE